MNNDNFMLLSADEASSITGGGCAVLGALIAAFAITQNWAAVAGGLAAAFNYGCFNSW
jgi:hypothetical protein